MISWILLLVGIYFFMANAEEKKWILGVLAFLILGAILI